MWESLRELLPVLASVAIKDPETRQLVARLVSTAEREVERRMSQTNKTRAEALAEYGAKWDENIGKQQALKDLPDNTP